MRVSLNVAPGPGVCSKCGLTGLVVAFGIITPEEAGEADTLCARCLFDSEGTSVDVELAPLAEGKAPRRKGLRKAKRSSLRQEMDVCEQLGARTQPASGAMAGAKSDGRKKGELRIEAKLTTADSYSLKLEELWKLGAEAAPGERSLFVIDFLDQGTRKLRDRFAVLQFNELKELLDGARKHL